MDGQNNRHCPLIYPEFSNSPELQPTCVSPHLPPSSHGIQYDNAIVGFERSNSIDPERSVIDDTLPWIHTSSEVLLHDNNQSRCQPASAPGAATNWDLNMPGWSESPSSATMHPVLCSNLKQQGQPACDIELPWCPNPQSNSAILTTGGVFPSDRPENAYRTSDLSEHSGLSAAYPSNSTFSHFEEVKSLLTQESSDMSLVEQLSVPIGTELCEVKSQSVRG